MADGSGVTDMGRLSERARRMLCECGCDEADVSQIDALCECGRTAEAVLRLRHRRAELMDDLHERQARVDLLDKVVRDMRANG